LILIRDKFWICVKIKGLKIYLTHFKIIIIIIIIIIINIVTVEEKIIHKIEEPIKIVNEKLVVWYKTMENMFS